MKGFKNLTAFRKHFKDDTACKEYLVKSRFSDGEPCCAYCRYSVVTALNNFRYKCQNPICGKTFSITTGTLFGNAKIKLTTWFEAVYLLSKRNQKLKPEDMAKLLGVPKKTAIYLHKKISNTVAFHKSQQTALLKT